MNLIGGKIVDERESAAVLETLRERIAATYENYSLSADIVIDACAELSARLDESEHIPLLKSLGMSEYKAKRELEQVRLMLSEKYLKERIKREFGEPLCGYVPYGGGSVVRQEWRPLGVLLHIAAGNVDALPVFSVIEGLITGNVNILKLPSGDMLSIKILEELIKIQPMLSEYIYVFGYSSKDIDAMKKLADAADAVVVWGADEAVSAVRRLAQPNTRIIEWGHKISFAYVSESANDDDLAGIAYNICDTNQLFCNSCQGIFVDTDDFESVVRFSERFSKILEKTCVSMPYDFQKEIIAQKTLEIYTEQIEEKSGRKCIFINNNSSVIAYNDHRLMTSYMFRNCWVRPLASGILLRELMPYKNHLQTAALICAPEERARLQDLLCRAGVVRITSGEKMSTTYCGAPHDGEFSLRRYMKIVSYEY